MSEGSKGRSFLPVLVAAAVLVAVALLVLRLRLEPPTVPAYRIAGADGGESVLRPGQPFHLDIEPRGQVAGAVGARAFLLRGDEVRPWDPPFVVDRDGTVHVAGAVDKLFAGIPPGPWEVAIVVGRPETLPTAPLDVLRARDAGTRDAAWRLVRRRILLGG